MQIQWRLQMFFMDIFGFIRVGISQLLSKLCPVFAGSKMKLYCVVFFMFSSCKSYHLNLTKNKQSIGSISIGENEITDYDSSSIDLRISTRSESNSLLESQDLFEGDILNVNIEDLVGLNIDERLAEAKPTQTWENGVVPYEISPNFDKSQKDVILDAIHQYHKHTCVKFVPREKNETDYVFIQPGKGGCSSSVGRQEGKQELNLGAGCMVVGIAQHELMHAIGFWHEQSRPDRDDFITIKWENIKDGKESNFLKHSWNLLDLLSMVYDVASLMHYGPFAFAKDPLKQTIVGKDGDDPKIQKMGQREHFSDIDMQKINTLYKCVGFNLIV